ncbi:MAG: SPOR domain-containing protein [Bacillota bacterium]
MEYRHRRRRRRYESGAGRIIIALLVVAAAIYVVSASALGTWLAQNVMAPVFEAVETALMGKAEEPAPTDGNTQVVVNDGSSSDANMVSDQIELPGVTCYMLQMGVYSQRNNALTLASTLQGRGAGGYIIEDGERYRVIASIYADEASLDAVRDQLKEEGMDSAVYPFVISGASFNVTAPEDQIGDMKAAFAGIKEAQASLSELAVKFDKESMTPEDGRAQIAQILADVETARADIQNLESDNELLKKIDDCYVSCIDALTELKNDTTKTFVDFSSKIKYNQIRITYEYGKLVEEVSSAS